MSENATQDSQYHIWYKGMIIESTGYLPTLAAAQKFARQRYGAKVQIQAAYPVLKEEKHDV